MKRILRIVHLVALAVFLGSIFGHIVLGRLAEADPAAALPLLGAKLAMIHALTLPGLGALVLSGAVLAFTTRPAQGMRRWLAAKFALVIAVGANGALMLTPIAERQVELAGGAGGMLSPEFAALVLRESVAGGFNLLVIAAIMALAVLRPALRGGHRAASARP